MMQICARALSFNAWFAKATSWGASSQSKPVGMLLLQLLIHAVDGVYTCIYISAISAVFNLAL